MESNLLSQYWSVFHFHFLYYYIFSFSLGCIPFQIIAVVENAVSGHPYHGVYLVCVCVRREVKRVVSPKLLFDYSYTATNSDYCKLLTNH
jgi:hypothetical protein